MEWARKGKALPKIIVHRLLFSQAMGEDVNVPKSPVRVGLWEINVHFPVRTGLWEINVQFPVRTDLWGIILVWQSLLFTQAYGRVS